MRRTPIAYSVAGVVLLAAIVVAGWWFLSRAATPPPAFPYLVQAGVSPADGSLVVVPLPAGWKEYRNEAYRFMLYYPGTLSVRTHDEGGGAATVVFESIKPAEGFQVFIVPYAANQVSEERFRQDEPSGVRAQMQAVSVDGAQGASFFSTNIALGETAEIWFIHDGYLYEVTTLKALAPWLSDVMQTWKFLKG